MRWPGRDARVASLVLAAILAAAPRFAGKNDPEIREEVMPGSGQRYTLAIPAGYTPDRPVPLVIALHYGGEVTPYFGKPYLTNLVEPGLRKLGAIIVAPDCNRGRWTSPGAEADVLALLDHVQKTWATDPQRTLLTGYSMGGMGTWAIAARHQDHFTAALIVAGRPQDASAEVSWLIPVYVIHSREDQVVPLKPTADLVKLLEEQGSRVKLVVVDDLTHYQVPAFARHLQKAVPWIQRAWKH
jgi:predicted peptidase